MGKGHLIDTNVVIYFLKGGLPDKIFSLLKILFEKRINFSVINKIELLSHRSATVEERISVHNLIELSNVYPLGDSVSEMTIHLKKKYKIKLADAIIAATAIVHDFILVTRNTKDFEKITELEIFNPFE